MILFLLQEISFTLLEKMDGRDLIFHPTSFPPPPRTLSQLEQQLFWAAVLGPLGRVKHFFLYGTAIFCPWKKENGFFWKACLALTPAWCSPCSAVSFPTWLV